MKTLKQASARLRGPNVRAVWAILLVLVIPAALTLYTVKVPMERSNPKLNPTPLGYTVSLLIYFVPVVAIWAWFCRMFDEGGGMLRRARAALRTRTPAAAAALDFRRGAFRRTLWTLIPIGFALDILFGVAFLKFEYPEATFFTFRFPALDFSKGGINFYIPLEEFVFYTLGFF